MKFELRNAARARRALITQSSHYIYMQTHRHCEDGGAPSLRCECAHFQLDPDHPTCTHVKCLQAFPREFDNALETPDGPTALPDGKGTTVAFYTRGAIVRQLGTGLSCSVDAHKHCRCVHVKDVEQAFGPSLQAAASDDTDDAARMIKEMVKGGYLMSFPPFISFPQCPPRPQTILACQWALR